MSELTAEEPPPGAALAADRDAAAYSLVLFVSGASASSARALRNVQAMCEEHLRGHYELAVIDVHAEDAAQQRRVLATPTLMRQHPLPERIRVGDFSDHAAVLAALGIPMRHPAPMGTTESAPVADDRDRAATMVSDG
jgi:circadian clock protein KaiB